MKFLDILKDKPIKKDIIEFVSESHTIIEKDEKPEELLRRAEMKIKLVTPTAFGIQFDLAKQYDEIVVRKVLKDFNIKIKGKSVFVIK